MSDQNYELLYNNLKQAIELEENCIRKVFEVLGEPENVSVVELAAHAGMEIKRLRAVADAAKAAKDYLRHMAERYRTDLAPGTWGWRTIAQTLDDTACEIEEILQDEEKRNKHLQSIADTAKQLVPNLLPLIDVDIKHAIYISPEIKKQIKTLVQLLMEVYPENKTVKHIAPGGK